jgi:hypothetical protein
MPLLNDYNHIILITEKSGGWRRLTKEETQKLGLSTKSVYFVPKNLQRVTKASPIITRRRKEYVEKGGLSYEKLAQIRRWDFKPFKEEKLKQIKRVRKYYTIINKWISWEGAKIVAIESSKSIYKKFGKLVIRFIFIDEDGEVVSTGMIYAGDINALINYLIYIAEQIRKEDGSDFKLKAIKRVDVSIEFPA